MKVGVKKLPGCESCVILRSLVLSQYHLVTDRHTDGHAAYA